MNAKWERFDNALSDLWRFFVPPIINAAIIVFVFFDLLQAAAASQYEWLTALIEKHDIGDVVLQDVLKIVTNYESPVDTIEKVMATTGTAFVTSLVGMAVGIFVIHQVVLTASRVIFGRLDLREEQLDKHPKVASSIRKIEYYLLDRPYFETVHKRWDYIKCINDSRDNMELYKARRTRLAGRIESQRDYATYVAAYWFMSMIALILNFTFFAVIIIIVTMLLYLTFAFQYLNYCVDLVRLDVQTFLAMADEGENRESDEVAEMSGPMVDSVVDIRRFVAFGEGHIGATVVTLFGVLKTIFIRIWRYVRRRLSATFG